MRGLVCPKELGPGRPLTSCIFCCRRLRTNGCIYGQLLDSQTVEKWNMMKERQWKGTYTRFVMDLYVIQWWWFGCGMLLLFMVIYNFNVGFLMHVSLIIPHIIQSHIWKKGRGSRNRMETLVTPPQIQNKEGRRWGWAGSVPLVSSL